MGIHPSDSPSWTIPILPKGSPTWIRWVIIIGFLDFGLKQPFVAVPIAAIVAVLMRRGRVTW